MKKLLGVSIAAMLAVTPMMASAANTVTTLDDKQGYENNQFQTNTNIATTSYVQGAYNSLATQINNAASDITVDTANSNNLTNTTIGNNVEELDTAMGKVSDMKVTTGNSITAGSVLKTAGGESTAAANNLTAAVIAINNELAANSNSVNTTIGQIGQNDSQTYIDEIGTGGNQKTVAQNLVALDAQVTTNTEALATLNANGGAGSIKNSIKTQAASADYDNTTSGLTNVTTIQGAIDNVEGRVDTLETSTTVTSAEATAHSVLTADAAVHTNLVNLATAIETLSSTTDTRSTVQDGEYIRANNYVGENLTNLDNAAKTNAAAINAILATTVPVYGTWGNTTPTTTVTIGTLQGGTVAGAPKVTTDATHN